MKLKPNSAEIYGNLGKNSSSCYFAVKMVLTGDEILQCDYSDKSYWAVLCCGCLYYDVQDNTNFWVSELNAKVWPFKWSF